MLNKSKQKRHYDKQKEPKPQPTRKELRRQLGWELAEAQRIIQATHYQRQ